jgi:hypothetical protein
MDLEKDFGPIMLTRQTREGLRSVPNAMNGTVDTQVWQRNKAA